MKVLAVDDHPAVRQGISCLLAEFPSATLHEAANGREARAIFQAVAPDVIVLDIDLVSESGLNLLAWFRDADKATRIVVFSMNEDASLATRALRAGALGYVSKSAPPHELMNAISSAARCRSYVDPETAARLSHLLRGNGP